MKDITFIIPCAGKGTRLGAPYPKELFSIDKNISLIDKCIMNLAEFKDRAQILIIISQEKMELVKYLSKYSDYDIMFIYQKPDCPELGGALRSCYNYLSNKNILLLPDLLILDNNIKEKLALYVDSLNSNKIAYLIQREPNLSKLSRLGNVKLSGNTVTKIQDKPTIEEIKINEYAHYWVSLGFTKNNADDFLVAFDNSIKKNNSADFSALLGGKFVEIDSAIDLGVWENINSYFFTTNFEKGMI